MSKKTKDKEEPKILSFYSLVQKDGGYKILELLVDINNASIVEAKQPTEPEVLQIAFSELQKKIRRGLGL